VFENRVLRRVFGPKRDKVRGSGKNYIMRSLMICSDEVTGSGENYIMRSLMICTPHSVLCG
jgi:hypothetical protein